MCSASYVEWPARQVLSSDISSSGNGAVIPLSLFLTTVADSGERKTTAEKMVMSTVAECEREFERERRELAAAQVPGEPPPLSGIRTIQDPTVVGFIAQSATLRGSIGMITSEAGIIVDGPMFSKHGTPTRATNFTAMVV